MWKYQNEKEAKRLQGAKKLKKNEGMVWAPPRNETSWLDWDEASRGKKHVKAGARRRNGGAEKSLSCRMRWGKHFRGLGWRKPP